MQLILYSKPGCHLCEGLQSKLETIMQMGNIPSLQLEIRDITTRDDWFSAYEYEVPVLFCSRDETGDNLQPIPRPSPRITVQKLEQILQKYL
ncbi:MAG: glutaredoxin family protein [Calothrix sp. MO_167.B42]|nr:glutaredoxin family protein [Calothrix sp. MO_167.B42]